ncbi:MAG TPA: GNAT family N-acetyltransferase [Rhodopila sp.]|nr:GNAT family N-acetyltransferase [Rhodopila sp.]
MDPRTDARIRLAVPDDRPVVEAIVAAAYAVYVPRIGKRPGPMLDDYGALIRAGEVHVLDTGEGIGGILVLKREDGAMLLDNIAVAPDRQGRGLGRILLAFAEAAALRDGYRTIRLYTHEAMTENIRLYTRIGYGETHRAEEKGFQRVYMSKRLKA